MFGIARRTANPQEHKRLVDAALSRFEAAAKCSDITFRTYTFAGGEILKEAVGPGQEVGHKRALLQSAREYYEAGLKLTEAGSDRRSLEQPLAMCLTFLASETTDTNEKRELFARAIAFFDSSAPAAGEQTDANMLDGWGLALLQLGQIDHDPSTLRLSIERLLAAIERAPNSANERYNLACAYALLNQPDQAVLLSLVRLCGVREMVAFAQGAFIGDIHRFAGPRQLVKYLGLNPAFDDSGSGE